MMKTMKMGKIFHFRLSFLVKEKQRVNVEIAAIIDELSVDDGCYVLISD